NRGRLSVLSSDLKYLILQKCAEQSHFDLLSLARVDRSFNELFLKYRKALSERFPALHSNVTAALFLFYLTKATRVYTCNDLGSFIYSVQRKVEAGRISSSALREARKIHLCVLWFAWYGAYIKQHYNPSSSGNTSPKHVLFWDTPDETFGLT